MGRLCIACDGSYTYVLYGSLQEDNEFSTSFLATLDAIWASKVIATPAAPAEEPAEFDPNTYLDPGYEPLARTPDDYIGEKVYIGGKVLQVTEDSGLTALRVASDYGYDDVVMVMGTASAFGDVRILENDLVDCYGTSGGIYTYTSTLGKSVSVPSILADKVIIQQ